MDLSLQLGQKIKSYRLARGLTIKELAEASQITSSMLSQIERGDYSPSVTLALKIAKVFEVQVEDIFWYEEEEEHDEQKRRN